MPYEDIFLLEMVTRHLQLCKYMNYMTEINFLAHQSEVNGLRAYTAPSLA